MTRCLASFANGTRFAVFFDLCTHAEIMLDVLLIISLLIRPVILPSY